MITTYIILAIEVILLSSLLVLLYRLVKGDEINYRDYAETEGFEIH